MTAIRFYVSGRVQGVWFRGWTQRVAQDLGLAGWVRNLPDGRVEGWAEGDEAAVDTLVERLHQGPSAARVTEVSVEDAEPAGLTAFEIRH